MKNKIFDKTLYFEGIRQNRIIGIITTIIFAVFTALIPIGDFVSSFYHKSRAEEMPFVLACYILFATIYVVAPMMTLHIFGFLNKRNTSDFYHAIPQSRKCIYLSFSASVVTWILFQILVVIGLAGVFYSISPTYNLQYETLLPTIFFFVSSALLVVSVFLISSSLTGRRMSNFTVALIILFAPTCLYHAFFTAIGSRLDSLLVLGEFGNFFGAKMNLPANFLTVIYGLSEYGICDVELMIACAYTFMLAIIYGAVGLFFFTRRKSETAGKAAPSQRWQNVFRIIFGFICSLIPIEIIYFAVYRNRYDVSDNIGIFYLIAVMYVFVGIGYFLYEIITTKGVRSLKKTFTGLLILLALNLTMIFGMIIATEYLLAFKPTAEQIDSVSIISVDDYYYGEDSLYYSSGELKGYFAEQESKVKITDHGVKILVANALSHSIEEFDEYNYVVGDDEDKTKCIVKINSGLRSEYRVLYLSTKPLNDYLKTNEEYCKIYTELPEYNKNHIKLEFQGEDSGNGSLSEESLVTIYDAYRNYLKEAGLEKARDLLTNSGYSSQASVFVTFDKGRSLEINLKSVDYYVEDEEHYNTKFPLYPLYAELYNKDNPMATKKVIDQAVKNEYFDPQIEVYLNGKMETLYVDNLDKTKFKDALLDIEEQKNTDYSNFIRIEVYDYYNEWNTFACYLPIDFKNMPDDFKDIFERSISYALETEENMFADGDVYSSPSYIPREVVKYSLKCIACGLDSFAEEYLREDFDYYNLVLSSEHTYEALDVPESLAQENGYYGLNYLEGAENKIVEVKRRKDSYYDYSSNYEYTYDEIYYFLVTREGEFGTWQPWRITDYVYYNQV